jgi:hypothetical protein
VTYVECHEKEIYGIINLEIHILVRIKPGEDWSHHAWMIHHKDDWYWIPIGDYFRTREKQLMNGEPECPRCKRKWYSEATKHFS